MSQRTHQFLALCSASVGASMKRDVVDVRRVLQVVQRRGDARVCHNMGRHFWTSGARVGEEAGIRVSKLSQANEQRAQSTSGTELSSHPNPRILSPRPHTSPSQIPKSYFPTSNPNPDRPYTNPAFGFGQRCLTCGFSAHPCTTRCVWTWKTSPLLPGSEFHHPFSFPLSCFVQRARGEDGVLVLGFG